MCGGGQAPHHGLWLWLGGLGGQLVGLIAEPFCQSRGEDSLGDRATGQARHEACSSAHDDGGEHMCVESRGGGEGIGGGVS